MLNKIASCNIKKLGNKYEGSSCYIFGDGISIKWFDISRFCNLPSILLGHFWFHNDVKGLNTIFGSLIEPFWFFPYVKYPPGSKKYIKNPIQSKYKEVIKNNTTSSFFINLSNLPTTWYFNNIIYVYKKFTFSEMNGHLLYENFNCLNGSFRFGVSLAIYLGFETIYLVGFDYTHAPSRSLHWYEKGTGFIHQNDDYQKDFILSAKNFADIITITLDGKSKHLDYITYKDFTGEDPVYRKNTEIVSPENLKVLSSWPGYTIY